ncbi:hypothetical protein D1872_301320 [compost metagenome]
MWQICLWQSNSQGYCGQNGVNSESNIGNLYFKYSYPEAALLRLLALFLGSGVLALLHNELTYDMIRGDEQQVERTNRLYLPYIHQERDDEQG